MRRLCFWLALLLTLAASASPITVGVYNVQNYLSTDRMVDGIYRMNYPKPEKEKAALVEVVKTASPDVLALVEMGKLEFLEEFRARLKSAGLDYPYFALLRGADTQRHLAILSKIKFEPRVYRELKFNYKGEKKYVLRGLLEARFGREGDPEFWRLYVVHLKSRYSDDDTDPDSDDFRTAEANAIREQIIRNSAGRGDPYLVVGDFNDSPRSSPLKRFLSKGKTTLTAMLRPVDNDREVWTHFWAAEDAYSRIDYILASPAMLPAVVPDSARIVDIPCALVASDHRMLVVTLDTALFGGALP